VRKVDTPKYLTAAHELYKILLALVAEHLTGKERLIIIPHGILYKVPFEALLPTPASASPKTSPVDYRKLDYLARHFDLSYHYSASLYARGLQQKEPKTSRNAFLGFAPVFRSNEMSGYTLASKDLPILRQENDEAVRAIVVEGWKFSELQYSEDEVKSIVAFYRQMLAGKSYAQALRQAKLKMMANKATATPRLWSSFVLIGN